ncbi:MAG: hypothetical protein LBL13_01015 [Bacteroidales bacterium]|jgi:hypothetical protein|nr:hypothetical protein [Bacteroidales bacterium]
MKQIILYTLTGMLIFTACGKKCIPKPPKDLKTVDWVNYNDVYTVYWNYTSSYEKTKPHNTGKIIKVSGWKVASFDLFYLCDNAKYAEENSRREGNTTLPMVGIDCSFPGFQAMLDTCDLTKKCFVKGELALTDIGAGVCRKVIPVIHVMEINDIYFESKKDK